MDVIQKNIVAGQPTDGHSMEPGNAKMQKCPMSSTQNMNGGGHTRKHAGKNKLNGTPAKSQKHEPQSQVKKNKGGKRCFRCNSDLHLARNCTSISEHKNRQDTPHQEGMPECNDIQDTPDQASMFEQNDIQDTPDQFMFPTWALPWSKRITRYVTPYDGHDGYFCWEWLAQVEKYSISSGVPLFQVAYQSARGRLQTFLSPCRDLPNVIWDEVKGDIKAQFARLPKSRALNRLTNIRQCNDTIKGFGRSIIELATDAYSPTELQTEHVQSHLVNIFTSNLNNSHIRLAVIKACPNTVKEAIHIAAITHAQRTPDQNTSIDHIDVSDDDDRDDFDDYVSDDEVDDDGDDHYIDYDDHECYHFPEASCGCSDIDGYDDDDDADDDDDDGDDDDDDDATQSKVTQSQCEAVISSEGANATGWAACASIKQIKSEMNIKSEPKIAKRCEQDKHLKPQQLEVIDLLEQVKKLSIEAAYDKQTLKILREVKAKLSVDKEK